MGERCAYLTMDDIGDFVSDADLSFAPMAELGWQVDMVPWRSDADWNDYDLVYICTPWDYQNDVDAFLDVLATIERSSARLCNSLQLVRWNLEKTYLQELESRGADIVPSRFFDCFDARKVEASFEAHGTGTIVLKPVVGANSDNIFVVTRPLSGDVVDELRAVFANRPFFVQPFMESVQSEGEYSLFFFGGGYSHAILKKPKLGVVNPQPVYVRSDFVRGKGERFLLMELELIEPALYFRTDAGSARRFARALTGAAA